MSTSWVMDVLENDLYVSQDNGPKFRGIEDVATIMGACQERQIAVIKLRSGQFGRLSFDYEEDGFILTIFNSLGNLIATLSEVELESLGFIVNPEPEPEVGHEAERVRMNSLESAIAGLKQDVTALSRSIRELKAETSNAVNDLASSFANELDTRCPVPMAPPPANGESWPEEGVGVDPFKSIGGYTCDPIASAEDTTNAMVEKTIVAAERKYSNEPVVADCVNRLNLHQ